MSHATNIVPPGTYIAIGRAAGLRKAGTGTPYVWVQFEIVRDYHAGKTIEWRAFLTDRAAPVTRRALAACGVHDLEDLSGIGTNEVELVVEMEETRIGSKRPRVRWVNPLVDKTDASEQSQELSAAEVRDLAIKFGMKPESNERANTSNDDTVPFESALQTAECRDDDVGF